MQITSLPGPFYKLYSYAEPQLRRETQAKKQLANRVVLRAVVFET